MARITPRRPKKSVPLALAPMISPAALRGVSHVHRGADLHAPFPAFPQQGRCVGGRIRQHIVHAWLFVRRLRGGTEELHANAGQPLHRRSGVLGQDPAQRLVLPFLEFAVRHFHVGNKELDAVVDACRYW